MFYKNQSDISVALCEVIDLYWNNEIKEKLMIESITKILKNNKDKIIKNNKFTSIIRQKCGKNKGS